MKLVLMGLLLLNFSCVAFADEPSEPRNPPTSGACHFSRQRPFQQSCADDVSKDNCDDQGGSWEPGGHC